MPEVIGQSADGLGHRLLDGSSLSLTRILGFVGQVDRIAHSAKLLQLILLTKLALCRFSKLGNLFGDLTRNRMAHKAPVCAGGFMAPGAAQKLNAPGIFMYKSLRQQRKLLQVWIRLDNDRGEPKIIIVWANQSCRTDCDFDPQFVKECK